LSRNQKKEIGFYVKILIGRAHYDESGIFKGLDQGKQGYAPIILFESGGVVKKFGSGIAALKNFRENPPPAGTPIRIRSYGHETTDPKSPVRVTITYPKWYEEEMKKQSKQERI